MSELGCEPPANLNEDTIFNKIIRKEIPANIVYENEYCVAFRDLHPQAPTHILIVPREKIPRLSMVEDDQAEILGHLLIAAKKIAVQEKLQRGYRLVINDGPAAGQTVYHLHVHLMGGRQLTWPPG